MPVIGLAGVGIAGRLCALDLVGQRGGPFVPGKQATFVQHQCHGEGLRFPRLAKHRAVVIAGNAWHSAGCARS